MVLQVFSKYRYFWIRWRFPRFIEQFRNFRVTKYIYYCKTFTDIFIYKLYVHTFISLLYRYTLIYRYLFHVRVPTYCIYSRKLTTSPPRALFCVVDSCGERCWFLPTVPRKNSFSIMVPPLYIVCFLIGTIIRRSGIVCCFTGKCAQYLH